MCTYASVRISRCWILAVFFAMLDIGAMNIIILHWLNKNEEVTRCKYLRDLAQSLVEIQVQRRLTIIQTPQQIKCKILDIFGADAPDKEYWPGRRYLYGFNCICPPPTSTELDLYKTSVRMYTQDLITLHVAKMAYPTVDRRSTFSLPRFRLC